MGTSFRQLMQKVDQAEAALEAQERLVAADWRQLKASWKQGWTPGRIVLAGVVAGFVVGRVEPVRAVAKGGTIMQMITALSGLVASATTEQAATRVESAAADVGDAAQAAAPVAPIDPAPGIE
ncbi:MAG TPA: hypothetical protein VFE72_06875 [Lysobacter sp.]|nr:hypothetical protein [Lysobacter sp.]